MNLFKRIGETMTTLIGLMVFIWFGINCMKFGWQARDNVFLRPLVATMLGVEVKEEDKGPVEQVQEWLMGDDKNAQKSNTE